MFKFIKVLTLISLILLNKLLFSNDCDKFASVEEVPDYNDILYKEAIKSCEKQLKDFPENKDYLYQLARAYYAAEDYEKSINFVRKALDSGSKGALELLAYHYYYGEGTKKNLKKAMSLFQKSSDLGFIDSTITLADIFAYGDDGIKKNEKKAFELMKKAENQGFSLDVVNYLGAAYIHGIGVPRDINKAIYYLEIAEKNDDPHAPLNLGFIYQVGDAETGIDYEKAYKYYKRSSELGNYAGTALLAQLYEHGLVNDKIEIDIAFDLYNKAAIEGGDLISMLTIGDFYKEGTGTIEKDLEEAKKWYLKVLNHDESKYENIINNNMTTGDDAILSAKAALEEVEKTLENIYVNVKFGNYYALLIGNQTYSNYPTLKNSLNDVRELKIILEGQYNYKVEVLENASEEQIWKHFYKYRNLKENDNLLIYYSGHGKLDNQTDKGYWLPVDADPIIPSRWISDDDIKSNLRAIKAKHIMIVADSCFSGTLLRDTNRVNLTDLKKKILLENLLKKKARVAFTSGGEEPVLDTGGGDHSIFAKNFLKVLSSNNNIISGRRVFDLVNEAMVLNANQTPKYNHIKNSGANLNSDYIFVPLKYQKK